MTLEETVSKQKILFEERQKLLARLKEIDFELTEVWNTFVKQHADEILKDSIGAYDE